MQQGGRIAQAGAPAELLAEPASDYVARFVGADRGLKRLSLYRVGDVDLQAAPIVRIGEPNREVIARARASGDDFMLLVDGARRPIGWIELADLAADSHVREEDADPMSPLLDRRDTLKDATSRLLDEEVRNGVVVDRAGAVLGLLTLRAVMDWMQDDRSLDVPEDIAEAVAEVVVHDEVPPDDVPSDAATMSTAPPTGSPRA
jgi:osmoprotectant transport system ATP-binding protein